MTRKEIVNNSGFVFSAEELVCKHIYRKFGKSALDFLDVRLLEVLLWLRTTIDKPIIINRTGANQRGMRCNLCEMVKAKTTAYLSSHVLGQGVDFNVKGMTAEQVRDWLKEHEDEIPHNIRLEIGPHVTWVHLDVRNETKYKIVYFKG